ncbi:unnamed protein product [Spirodela intermedia]|uniref:Uncharacterized protein n=1 Tax=Spirodela intermedia TaxID=51605 RepID=A0A7I8J3X4_SPIIN|nr:unnamed protein product [Spirodela intermedia]CAA6664956.1 unnamed protein product [Spirodela intermedia]
MAAPHYPRRSPHLLLRHRFSAPRITGVAEGSKAAAARAPGRRRTQPTDTALSGFGPLRCCCCGGGGGGGGGHGRRRPPHAGLTPAHAAGLRRLSTAFWPKSWGIRPPEPERALRRARAALQRAPLLIPLFDRCYIPCNPCLAGNPVFFVDESRILCCGLDLADFFEREALFRSPLPSADLHGLRLRPDPRWIEFWSDAACDRRRRISSSSSSSSSSCSSSSELPPHPQAFLEIRPPKLPKWVAGFLDRIGEVLRDGGWGPLDVEEMVHVPSAAASRWPDDGGDDSSFAMAASSALVDSQAVFDSLLLKADRCSDSLRRAGWSSEEVTDALGFDFRRRSRKEGPRPPSTYRRRSPRSSPPSPRR